MRNVTQSRPAVNPQFAVSGRHFAAFSAAVHNAFPSWERGVQIVWKPTVTGPVAKLHALGGFHFADGDLAIVAEIAEQYAPVATEAIPVTVRVQPVSMVNWPQSKGRKPSIKMGRGSAWAGVR